MFDVCCAMLDAPRRHFLLFRHAEMRYYGAAELMSRGC